MSSYTTTWTYDTSKQSEARLDRKPERMWVEWCGYHYKPLLIRLNGNYVAKRHMNTLIIAELAADVGPGNMTSDAQFCAAKPVVAIHIESLASINVIRQWLNAMEKSVTPTWQYKDGD